MRNDRQNHPMWMKEDEKHQQVNQFQKQLKTQLIMGEHILGENQYTLAAHEQPFDGVGEGQFDDRRNQFKAPFNN